MPVMLGRADERPPRSLAREDDGGGLPGFVGREFRRQSAQRCMDIEASDSQRLAAGRSEDILLAA